MNEGSKEVVKLEEKYPEGACAMRHKETPMKRYKSWRENHKYGLFIHMNKHIEAHAAE